MTPTVPGCRRKAPGPAQAGERRPSGYGPPVPDDLRSSLRAAVRTWLLTAQRMLAVLDDETLSRDEMLERLEAEQAECLRAMETVDAELEQARE